MDRFAMRESFVPFMLTEGEGAISAETREKVLFKIRK